jgi:sterol-4alpha-carboxylate 3-dehydrogenase (decarboxylating)
LDQKNLDESFGYPAKYRDYYCETKALAEQAVVAAAKAGRVAACAIRPHGIFGPRDLQLMPTVASNAAKGKGKFTIGDGSNIVDFTYVGNVVHGHLLAAAKVTPGHVSNGQVYFITNDEPVLFWDFLARIQVGFGYDAHTLHLPYKPLLALATAVQAFLSLIAPIKRVELTFSPSRLQIAGTFHYYSCAAAKRDLGYKPVWSVEEGLALTLASAPHLWNPAKPRPLLTDEANMFEYHPNEVANHNKATDAWLIVDGRVYDVTSYVEDHSGGDKILNNVGGDSTAGFHGDQHPDNVKEVIKAFCIGKVMQE